MRYSDIKFPDIANGPGVRVSLWLCGCHFHCKECQNPELWDFNAGEIFDTEAIKKIFDYLELDFCEGLSILGGEPLEKVNEEELTNFLEYVKWRCPIKSVWLYTGYKFEDIKEHQALQYVDILVDGQYEDDRHIVDLKFRGSTNQRKIDIQKSLETGETVEMEF